MIRESVNCPPGKGKILSQSCKSWLTPKSFPGSSEQLVKAPGTHSRFLPPYRLSSAPANLLLPMEKPFLPAFSPFLQKGTQVRFFQSWSPGFSWHALKFHVLQGLVTVTSWGKKVTSLFSFFMYNTSPSCPNQREKGN